MANERLPSVLLLLGSFLVAAAVLPRCLGQSSNTTDPSSPPLGAPPPPPSTTPPTSNATNFYTGTFINCGGPAFVGRNSTWAADRYATAGDAFGESESGVNATGTFADAAVFRTMRFFGGQEPEANTYSVPVSANGYYYVRLYFAEILYTNASVRIFNVSIEGVPVLENFEVPALLKGQMEEFFVPVLDGRVDITFIRGPIGDPMVSGIAVIPAPEGMYGLNTTSGTTLSTEYRIACGSAGVLQDQIGRIWTGDLFSGLFSPPDLFEGFPDGNGPTYNPDAVGGGWSVYPLHTYNVTNYFKAGGEETKVTVEENLDAEPELLPKDVYSTSRWTDASVYTPLPEGATPDTTDNSSFVTVFPGPFVSLNYTFTVEPNTDHMVRVGWAYLSRSDANNMVVNVSIDDTDLIGNLDLWLAKGYDGPYLRNIFVKSNSTGRMVVAIHPSSYENVTIVRDVMVNSIEVFRVGRYNASKQAELLSANTPSPPPPALVAPSRSTDKKLWTGVAIGVAVGIVLAALCLGILFILPRLRKRSDDSGDFESLKESKEGKSDYINSGSFGGYLLGEKSANNFFGGSNSKFGDKTRPTDSATAARTGLWGAQVFSLAELKAGSNDFSPENILGHGGFGVVYKATLASGHVVAVKRLDIGSQQGEREFLTEVELLSRLHHRNLVNLVGYSDEDNQLMLIYEFVPNGTLRDYLRDEEKAAALTWPARLKIALGAAKGIEYLHRGATPPVIHRDIKTSNILLENNFDAKVADFGLSKLGRATGVSTMEQTHITTNVKGTVGYLDPNYYTKQQLTEKSDVYSFGVVLLEMLTGRLPIWYEPGEDSSDDKLMNLVEWVAPFLKRADVAPIVALQLDVGQSLPSMVCVARLALRCVDMQGKSRPTISDVVRDLEEAKRLLDSAPPPTIPPLDDLESSFAIEPTLLSKLATQTERTPAPAPAPASLPVAIAIAAKKSPLSTTPSKGSMASGTVDAVDPMEEVPLKGGASGEMGAAATKAWGSGFVSGSVSGVEAAPNWVTPQKGSALWGTVDADRPPVSISIID